MNAGDHVSADSGRRVHVGLGLSHVPGGCAWSRPLWSVGGGPNEIHAYLEKSL